MTLIEAQKSPQQTEPLLSLEEKFAREDQQARAERYYAPSSVIPDVAVECGAEMNWVIAGTLRGEGMQGDENTSGLARASREIGHVINGRAKPYTLFADSSVRAVEKTIVDEYDQQEYIEIDYLPPEKEKLEAFASSRSVNSAGRLFARLLQDAAYPYEKQPGDDFVELSPRSPERATLFTGRYSTLGEFEAHLCANTETHFVAEMNGGLREIKQGDDVVALRKHSGDHTAILIKPAILNGVRLPPGTIVIPEGNEEDGYLFGFGRFSMFNAADAAEAVLEFPSIAHREADMLWKGNPSPSLSHAMARFKELAGEDYHDAQSLLSEYYVAHDSEGGRLNWSEAVSGVLSEIGNKLDDSENQHIVRQLDVLRAMTQEAGKLAWEDKERVANNDQPSDPTNRESLSQKIRLARLQMHKMFGADKVAEVEKLLRLRTEIASS